LDARWKAPLSLEVRSAVHVVSADPAICDGQGFGRWRQGVVYLDRFDQPKMFRKAMTVKSAMGGERRPAREVMATRNL
jgi:hypothetical protein